MWSLITIVLLESKSPGWWKYLIAWTIAGACDVAQIATNTEPWADSDRWRTTHLVIQLARIAILALAILPTLCLLRRENPEKGEAQSDGETESLLGAQATAPSSRATTTYGSTANSDDDFDRAKHGGDDDESVLGEDDQEEDRIKLLQKQRLQEVGWVGYLKGFLIFMPHIIPYKDRVAQFWLMVLVACLSAQRLTTLFIPIQLAKIIDALTSSQNTGTKRAIAAYIL